LGSTSGGKKYWTYRRENRNRKRGVCCCDGLQTKGGEGPWSWCRGDAGAWAWMKQERGPHLQKKEAGRHIMGHDSKDTQEIRKAQIRKPPPEGGSQSSQGRDMKASTERMRARKRRGSDSQLLKNKRTGPEALGVRGETPPGLRSEALGEKKASEKKK